MAGTSKKPEAKAIAHPPFRQTLFWDVDPKTIDPERHARYIIERILDLGNDDEVRWLFHYYPHSRIKAVLKDSRVLHEKSKILWSLVLQ
ncbi:MAG: hypothetical protein Q8R13_05175 [bacterium]|nr:hypothetical protein [bacterium]MDZ4296346.1 hypothetical protein [Patescibacteria group bacterium]